MRRFLHSFAFAIVASWRNRRSWACRSVAGGSVGELAIPEQCCQGSLSSASLSLQCERNQPEDRLGMSTSRPLRSLHRRPSRRRCEQGCATSACASEAPFWRIHPRLGRFQSVRCFLKRQRSSGVLSTCLIFTSLYEDVPARPQQPHHLRSDHPRGPRKPAEVPAGRLLARRPRARGPQDRRGPDRGRLPFLPLPELRTPRNAGPPSPASARASSAAQTTCSAAARATRASAWTSGAALACVPPSSAPPLPAHAIPPAAPPAKPQPDPAGRSPTSPAPGSSGGSPATSPAAPPSSSATRSRRISSSSSRAT